MKNLENIKRVLDHIENHPEQWNQEHWHCQTAHCFAGHAQLMLIGADNVAEDIDEGVSKTRRDARIFFGFSEKEADYYFDWKRTLAELKTALLPFYDENGYGREGYDRNGYDRDGYNIRGYDKDGYDREGYDVDGLDRENNPKPNS